MRIGATASWQQLGCAALGVLLACLTWAYCSHLNEFTQKRFDSQGFGPRNFSDLYPAWLGSRELLLHRTNPYSEAVTTEIQRGYYGRPIDPRRPDDPVDQQRFAYPLFLVLLFAPTVRLPFVAVQIIFEALFLALAMLTVWLWAKELQVFFHWSWNLAVVVFGIASIPYMLGLLLQQLTILVAFCLAGAFAAVRRGNGILAGILLAIAAVKPQLSLPFILWILLWSLSGEARRWRIVLGFGLAMAALLACAQALMPGWMVDFAHTLGPYLRYTDATSGLSALLGKAAGDIVTAISAAGVGLFCWRCRAVAPGSFEFSLASVLVLTLTAVAVPTLAPHIEVILIPACLLLWRQRRQVLTGRFSRPLWYGSFLVVIWPWISAAGLSAAAAVLPLKGEIWNLPLATNPMIPIVLFIGLLPIIVSSMKRLPSFPQALAPSAALVDEGREK